MAWQRISGMKGKVFVPDAKSGMPKKHTCPDCHSCQQCSEDRCRVCRIEPNRSNCNSAKCNCDG